ncbi:cysteine peptidase family C39 domain-containing protein [Flavobacterium fryxellicola]|uniref:hypothetical protein n=1 Tax=Flavobacterium fryxellicola TaxID=249352 RepID=UPI001114C08C|nr:hypothetical protein [Flavobacterium fryxellicola]
MSIFQSCSPEEVVLQNESLTKSRDYSFKKINFLELKKINNQAFIESAKLKNVVASDKNKTSNSTFNYDIDLQNIQYVKRANDDETFSFRIFQVPTATFQQNIIVEFKKNEEPQSYLVTYYLNKQVNQINNSNDFIRAIKSTSTVKIENQLKTHRTTSGGCLQVGYYEEVDACEGNLDTSPRCYNSDGTRATINVFKVIDSACSTGGGPTDFIPLASQWDFSNTSSSNPYSEYTGTTTGGSTAGGETTDLNIFLPNYFEGSDLSDPAVQNMLQINQFITTLYNSSNEIKGVIDNTEWLMAYTNYWIGTNGGLTSSNQIALTYAFNNIPTIFNQYYNNDYTPSQVANFKFSVFQFLLYHGEWLSNLDPQIQISILETITSFEQIEFVNGTINFMIENPSATWENIFHNRTALDRNSAEDLDNNQEGGNDTSVYSDFNPQQTWTTINRVIRTSQFVGWGTPGIKRNCMDYAKAQIAKNGYQISNYGSADQTLQIYDEQNGVNNTNLKKGLSYLKYALSNNIPVIVGIDDNPGHPGNPDKSTDHFVVLVGMGSNSNGNYFQFYDNASGTTSQGTSSLNLLYYNPQTGKISGKSQCVEYVNSVAHDYIITQIRKSKPKP